MGQSAVGHRPPVVLRSDHGRGGHPGIGQEGLVEQGVPGHFAQWPDFDTGLVHVEGEVGDVAAPVFSTIVGETLRALNVAPDASVSKKALQDQSSTDTHIAIANTQLVVLKR